MTTDPLTDAGVHGDASAKAHARNVSILDALRYAPILVALVDAFKTGGRVEVPTIRTYTPWGRRKLSGLVIEDDK